MDRKEKIMVSERYQFIKKCMAVVIAFIVTAMAVVGCSSPNENGKKVVDTSNNSEQDESQTESQENVTKGAESTENVGEIGEGAETENASGGDGEGTETEDVSENVYVEEQTLLEQDGVKITLKELEKENLMGPELKLLIENNSEQNLTIQTRETSVNGIMIESLFSCDVAAGKSANDGIAFMSSELEEAQINVLQNFELSFHIFNTETWDTVFDTDTIKISTNLDGSEEQAVDSSGVLLLEQNGVKITVKEADDQNSFWGADIYIYVENNTDKSITVQAASVSVNGFMVQPYFSCEVAAGKKSYDTITFMEEELKENNIESIDDMEVSFTVFDSDSFDTVLETEPLKVEFEKVD